MDIYKEFPELKKLTFNAKDVQFLGTVKYMLWKSTCNLIQSLWDRPDITKEQQDRLKLHLQPDNFFLAGGAIASSIQGETPEDFDIYFKRPLDADAFFSFIQNDNILASKIVKTVIPGSSKKYSAPQTKTPVNLNLNPWQGSHPGTFPFPSMLGRKIPEYDPVMKNIRKLITHNAITMKNKLQFISKLYAGEPEDVVAKFDLVHCKAYLDLGRMGSLHISPLTYHAIKNKVLIHRDLKTNPGVEIDPYRLKKLVDRGYTDIRDLSKKQYSFFIPF